MQTRRPAARRRCRERHGHRAHSAAGPRLAAKSCKTRRPHFLIAKAFELPRQVPAGFEPESSYVPPLFEPQPALHRRIRLPAN